MKISEQISDRHNEDNVRDRLLDAAEKLFCRDGFERISVRELTAEAGCNIAAVNYYFGGKRELYFEMFRRQIRNVSERHFRTIDRIMAKPDTTLEELLREIISMPLQDAFENQPRLQIMRLMVREVLNKAVQSEQLIGEFKVKFLEKLSAAFVKLVRGLSRQRAELAVLSIDALVSHPLLFMEFYPKIMPQLKPDELVEHIVHFAAAGIRGFVKADNK